MASDRSVRRMIVATSGDAGAIYGIRLLEALRALEIESHLVVSDGGGRAETPTADSPAAGLRALADAVYASDDIAAAISSGSFRTLGMIVAPCSARILGDIAHGVTPTLVARAADVCLKERRRLVLLFRETPLHAGHLKSMLAVTEMGGIISPPVPPLHGGIRTIDDSVTYSIARALDLFDLDIEAFSQGSGAAEVTTSGSE